METRILTAHVRVPLAAKLDELANRLERSRGWIVKQALTSWIDAEEAKRRLTLEAMAEVDAGKTGPDDAVRAWAGTLDKEQPSPLPRARSR